MIELIALSPVDKIKYFFTEKLYSKLYFCVGCNCDFWVKGAFANRIYFCNDCGTELLK